MTARRASDGSLARYLRRVGSILLAGVLAAAASAGNDANPTVLPVTEALVRNEGPPSAASEQGKNETLKERLSDKASDQQRVDNCKVSPEKRGPIRRPDSCPSRPRDTAEE